MAVCGALQWIWRHNFRVVDSQRHLLGIAIHSSELPAVAVTQLQRDHPECEDSASGLFYFELVALPFGLAPSCAVFSDIVTALTASWRRHKVCDQPVRLSSYIDDSVGVMRSLRAALILAVELTYEVYAVGLTLNEKCRLCLARSFTYLGLVIDTVNSSFKLPAQRALRLAIQAKELAAASTHHNMVSARSIAQFLGLLWSASPCMPRAVSIMTRGLVDTLAKEM